MWINTLKLALRDHSREETKVVLRYFKGGGNILCLIQGYYLETMDGFCNCMGWEKKFDCTIPNGK